MSAGYVLTPKAEEGLLRITLYLEERFGPRVTDESLARIERALLHLAEMPGIGHSREDLTIDSSVSFWSVPPTLIAYRHDRSPIEVLFIERGEMDWERLLRDASTGPRTDKE